MPRSRSAQMRPSLSEYRFSIIESPPDPHPYPSPQGGGESSQGFMAAVAQRLVRGALAGAEPDLFAQWRLPLLRPEFGTLVRAVAERLRCGAPAGAPPIALAGLDIDRNRFPAANLTYAAHVALPPPSVASH